MAGDINSLNLLVDSLFLVAHIVCGGSVFGPSLLCSA